MTKRNHGSQYWRSLEALSGGSEAQSFADREFQDDATELEVDGVSRRRFMGILGASAAFAGVTTGCVRKPEEKILPFAKRPEDLIPGRPVQYATAFALAGTVQGVLVTSVDGRPTKIEGNPKHPGSQGATNGWAQASILDLYDPERSRSVRQGEADATWDAAKEAIGTILKDAGAGGGAGLALVVESLTSPTIRGQLEQFRTRFPKARVFLDDPGAADSLAQAAEQIGDAGSRVRRHLDQAMVVLAADADFLNTEADSVRISREWSRRRRVDSPDDLPSRLYAVEPHFTNTGMCADHRRAIKGSEVGPFLGALAKELQAKHGDKVQVPRGADAVLGKVPVLEADEGTAKFISALASDLAANPGKSAIVVGQRQPAWVQGLGLLIDAMLRNQGQSLRWHMDPAGARLEDLSALAAALGDGSITTVFCLGTNPAYNAAGSLGMADLLKKATVVHVGTYVNETAAQAAWHIPCSHYLEAWGDEESGEGAVSICQPLIAPLHDTYGMVEIMGFLATGNMVDGYSLVKGHWMKVSSGSFSDRSWRRWLHDGLVSGVPRDPRATPKARDWGKLAELVPADAGAGAGMEVNFHLDPKLFDGRFSNNAWLQEVPHPMTKLVWDNAALVSVKTAEDLGVQNGDLLDVTVGGRTLQIPVWIAPGQADQTVSISLGYGRSASNVVADGAGFNANQLRGAASPWFEAGDAKSAGGTYKLVSTQDHGTMKPHVLAGFDFPERPIAMETTREDWAADPTFVEKASLMPKERLKHLWDPPPLTGKQQWGMAIDLGTCTGCNACVVACHAENNIPVVGKNEVANGRELHWIRIDRYFRGDMHEPTAIVQPMGCQHCESAPCETVCPVAATTHTPDGINDMIYNRCIGTRYCSNNCPYKVRRFNFFNFNLELDPLLQMQKNPNVTVRFRGVMEKCTYCMQRIAEAKIVAHSAGQETVPDGTISTACQQVCPTEAIAFGDVKDPNSKVSKLKAQSRNYSVLRDLNTGPRTTYLARIRNPNPELA